MIGRLLRAALVAVGSGGAAATASAQDVELQAFLGSAWSAPLPIAIAQDGAATLRFTARWDTRPAEAAWYYAWRVGLWRGDRGWRLDHTHHKLHLSNPPPEVEAFQVTNGFNLVTLSRAFRRGHLTWSAGAGPVIAFPVNTVRGKPLPDDTGVAGYHLSGASLIAMATREIPLAAGLVLSLDARASASWARIPVADGHASVPNTALHLHVGLGFVSGR